MKNQKGVTLVALVVTIIILIILAGISINLLLGDNGIITIAKKAKENTELAKTKEENELNELYTQLENNGGTSEETSYDESAKLTDFKTKVADAITNKGVKTSKDDTVDTFVENIYKISSQNEYVVDYYFLDYKTTETSSEDINESFLVPDNGKLIIVGGSFFYNAISVTINEEQRTGTLIEDTVGNGRRLMTYIEDVKEGDNVNVSAIHSSTGNYRGTNIVALLIRKKTNYTILDQKVTNTSSEDLNESFSIPNDGKLIVVGWSCFYPEVNLKINNESKGGKLINDVVNKGSRKLVIYAENVKKGDNINASSIHSTSGNDRGTSMIAILLQ